MTSEQAAGHLLALCELRNIHARSYSLSSYPELALSAQCLAKKGIGYSSIRDRLAEPAGDPRELGIGIPSMERYWTVFGTALDDAGADCSFCGEQHLAFIGQLLHTMGLDRLRDSLHIAIKQQPFAAGIAFDLSESGDRRAGILVRPDGMNSLFVAAHELGHALLYIQRTGDLRFIPSWLDESHAYLVEDNNGLIRNVMRLYFSPAQVDRLFSVRETLRMLDRNRVYASFLTEEALWEAVDQPRTSERKKMEIVTGRCRAAYRRLVGAEYDDPLQWAFDSFRSVDPVYVHSYNMAQDIAASMLESSATLPVYSVSTDAIRRLLRKIPANNP